MEEEREKTLKEEIKDLTYLIESQGRKKDKKFRMPFKGKLGKNKVKKGYVTIMEIHENRNVSFNKKPITDQTFKLDDTFHTTNGGEMLFYKNKPLIIQATKKLNPYNVLEGKNETYGQKYVMAKMISDHLTSKKKVPMGTMIIILVGVAGLAYFIFSGGI